MSTQYTQHNIYENTYSLPDGDSSLINGHVKPTPNSSKTTESHQNGHPLEQTVELAPHDEVVAVQPPSPTIHSAEVDVEPTRKVRFYGRVRITSGVGHTGRPKSNLCKKENSQDSLQDGYHNGHAIDVPPPRRDASRQSPDSSTSASYSSSISAPLRSSTELPPRPVSSRYTSKKRKPLSNVLGAQDANTWLHALAIERREQKNKRMAGTLDETSPLLQEDGSARTTPPDVRRVTVEQNGHKSDDEESVDDNWPWKLFTLYYWEARLSALCCCETDSED